MVEPKGKQRTTDSNNIACTWRSSCLVNNPVFKNPLTYILRMNMDYCLRRCYSFPFCNGDAFYETENSISYSNK